MKKLILLTAAIGLVSLTSCEKTAEGVRDGVEATGDGIKSGTDAVVDGAENVGNDIKDAGIEAGSAMEAAYADAKAAITGAPEVADTELQEWANKLHDEAVNAKAASMAGNQDELNEAMTEMSTLQADLEKHAGKPGYAEAEAYYNKVKADLENM